uniref:ADP-ribosylation factor-like 8 n=1 Tax=Astyanax mexicanus TaxID=7994 RepID=A0A3B1IGA9_ASTMX
MGLIVAKLWSFFCNQEHKVIIVGLDNAGKTTILYQFLMKEVVHTSPTIGSNVEEIVVKNTHFLMWDIGGQESLRASWNTYYSNTEVTFKHCFIKVVIVFSLSGLLFCNLCIVHYVDVTIIYRLTCLDPVKKYCQQIRTH